MKRLFIINFIVLFALINQNSTAQLSKGLNDTVFLWGEVSRVDILIDSDSLAEILESGNEESYHEYPATFIFQNSLIHDTITNIGFRLRGNTSRWSAKKSFKVSFNSFSSSKFFGLEKMNLNGEHNDPSIIRSRLSWELFENIELPASRSAYTELYINSEYKGLYINVEHVDDEFVYSRFGNKSGNLFKCLWPADLVYLGDDPDLYKFEQGDRRAYDLRTNEEVDDYSDLAHFIDVLNNSSDAEFATELEKVFNVNAFIKYLVVEILTGHWDAYSVNKNNFYLYNNLNTGKFEFIPYDMDNTFGIDWFDIDWGNRNIYNWASDWEDRPLYNKVLDNEEYRNQFSFYMNKFIDEYFNNVQLFEKIDDIKSIVDLYREDDIYATMDYGWSFNDYNSSFNEALGAHVTYGLKPYIAQRFITANSQLILSDIFPAIVHLNQQLINDKQTLIVSAKIDDESTISVKLIYEMNDEGTDSVFMYDNGNDYDTEAGDRFYTVGLDLSIGIGVVSYYIKAEDESGQISRYPRGENIEINIDEPSVKLLISEFMASNSSTIVDNFGEFDDWLEIYNAGIEGAFLGDKYLTDDLSEPDKWLLPNVILEPGEYYLIWADNDAEQGANHTNFKLSKDGEEIGIFEGNNSIFTEITSVSFSVQQSNISSGILNEDSQQFQTLESITPNYGNNDVSEGTVTFNIIMSYQQVLGNFNSNVDIIDLPGTFNNWSGSGQVYDANDDLTYTYTLFNLPVNEHIEYKFRINENWGTAEFPGGDNREYDITSGLNNLTHWYNDAVDPNILVEGINTSLHCIIWPNPVRDQLFVKSDRAYDNIEIVDIMGKVIFIVLFNSYNQYIDVNYLKQGIYFLNFYKDGLLINSSKMVKTGY